MQTIIKFIYDGLNAENKADNVFENTPEKYQAETKFEKLYIDTIKNVDYCNVVWDDFICAVMEAREVAFEIGFKAGVKAMIESLGKNDKIFSEVLK